MSMETVAASMQAEEFQWEYSSLGSKYRLPFDAMLAMVEATTSQPDMLAYLDDLDRRDSNKWYAFRNAFTCLPGKVIYQNYGPEALIWAAANATHMEQAQQLRASCEADAGLDKDLVNKARLWVWQERYNSLGKEVLRDYRVMEDLYNGGLDAIDLDATLTAAVRPGVALSEARKQDYSIIPLRAKDYESSADGYERDWYKEVEPGLAVYIWMDAPTGFALCYKGRPNAMVAIASPSPDEIMVYQLQGVQARRVNPDKRYTDEYEVGRISSRGLMPFDWQKLMLSAAEQYAAGQGFTSLGLQAGSKNKWAKKILRNETEPHLSPEAAAKAYDEPAERLGFTLQEDGNWHRAIS